MADLFGTYIAIPRPEKVSCPSRWALRQFLQDRASLTKLNKGSCVGAFTGMFNFQRGWCGCQRRVCTSFRVLRREFADDMYRIVPLAGDVKQPIFSSEIRTSHGLRVGMNGRPVANQDARRDASEGR